MHLSPPLLRGLAIGLWVLAGLSYLVRVVLPGSTAQGTASPLLLAVAVAWTALLPASSAAPRPVGAPPRRLRALFLLLGGFLAAGTALVIIAEGDQRSFLYVVFTIVVVLAFSVQFLRKGRESRSPRS